MIHRTFDLPLLIEATECQRNRWPVEDFITWFNLPQSVMLTEGKNVGLATYMYPGAYTVHWYFQVRGRKAINLGKDMCQKMFDDYDARILRAIIDEDLRASRWACRQIGFRSMGIMEFPDGPAEVYYLTEKDIKHG